MRAYSHTQLVHAADLVLHGVPKAEAMARVWLPEALLDPDEKSVGVRIMEAVRRGSPEP